MGGGEGAIVSQSIVTAASDFDRPRHNFIRSNPIAPPKIDRPHRNPVVTSHKIVTVIRLALTIVTSIGVNLTRTPPRVTLITIGLTSTPLLI